MDKLIQSKGKLLIAANEWKLTWRAWEKNLGEVGIWEKILGQVGIWEKTETVLNIATLRLAKILRKVLEDWKDLLLLVTYVKTCK